MLRTFIALIFICWCSSADAQMTGWNSPPWFDSVFGSPEYRNPYARPVTVPDYVPWNGQQYGYINGQLYMGDPMVFRGHHQSVSWCPRCRRYH